ncbi:M20 family metallo-hydrolase [Methylobacterium sp. NEAU 140]|uniref:M20 family metallo-hydrolase n=1 Tax=Methylobacterium sp. NEAU 140 TaxID=3064945 RepID=UPI0027368D75|nr:M20 family metallo-hydrolase [Methylobacterium sp. NEAU 140]MDP4022003.1 M20 family metallo-hydrolase [Methylobacterium sp. NEAU 140]
MQNLTIDAGRLWDSLHETAAFGACEGGGINRLTLTDDDKRVRDWFRRTVEALGCTVTIDEVGNMFARRPGRRDDLLPIAIGSHLDTQPTGGKFDGILGVLAGVEILRTFHDTGYVTNAPIEIINWTNEEGTRFAPAMLCSGVFAGVFDPEFAWSRTDRDGIRFDAALEGIGYKGSAKAGDHRLGAVFELHIEQGPILEAEEVQIGVVTGVQGARWYDLRLNGNTGHTGATPMRLRRNALVGASQVVLAVDGIAGEFGPDAVASVGRLDVSPNSRNVVPGEVFLTVDLRHPDDGVLEAMARAFEGRLAGIRERYGLEMDLTPIWKNPAVRFASELVDCVQAGADQAGFSHRRMVSGAGHDAAYLARVAPTTMIFVPCLGGISHNVAESTTREECAAGAQVLLNAVIAHDNTL